MKRIFCFCLLLISFHTSFAQSGNWLADSLDNYIRQGLQDWKIPGLSIVVVKDGKVIWMKGYGVKDIVSKEPVDENTLFMIASNTKLFTGTSLAQLEYNHKLSLNDKITRYFPDYALYDPASTGLLTIRDLLCHRIGTKTFQGDFTFWNGRLSRKEIMQKMRLLKPTGIFRQDYGYCNSCFMTAGQVIPQVTGQQWEEYVRDSILLPLQMTNTYTISKGMASRKNVSKPYTTSFTGSLQQVPYDEWDNLGPAASIISNVSDLSHWLMFQLDSGWYAGSQVMPFAVLQKTRDINIVTRSRKSAYLPTHIVGYGLGVLNADYNGRQIYWHTGGAGGMVSNVCFVPEEKLGIAILTNNDNQEFFEALRYQVLDHFLGVPYTNRSAAFLDRFNQEMNKSLGEIEGWKARVKGSAPPLPPASYAGHYLNPLYGSMDVRVQGNRLLLTFNGHDHLSATADYMDQGAWLLRYDNIEYGIFSIGFQGEAGKEMSVSIKANDFVEYDPYIFTRP
jgi:CubicO group peptidase (beta-lactamase class C family)